MSAQTLFAITVVTVEMVRTATSASVLLNTQAPTVRLNKDLVKESLALTMPPVIPALIIAPSPVHVYKVLLGMYHDQSHL